MSGRVGEGTGTAGGPERAAYREWPPAAALAPHLVCVWTQVAPPGGGSYLHRVLPDGCADVVCIGGQPPVVVGPATLPAIVALPPAAVVVGARFRPGVAPAWVGVGAAELLNATVALRDLWGGGAAEMADRLAEAGSARLGVLQAALGRRLAAVRPGDPLVARAVPWLAHEGVSVDDVARRLGLSDRQLRRRFRDWVGYGPKTLHRILRLQRLLLLAECGAGGLGGLALAAGYADQPHMTREVGELAGVTPRALLAAGAATLRMSDLFKTEAWGAG